MMPAVLPSPLVSNYFDFVGVRFRSLFILAEHCHHPLNKSSYWRLIMHLMLASTEHNWMIFPMFFYVWLQILSWTTKIKIPFPELTIRASFVELGKMKIHLYSIHPPCQWKKVQDLKSGPVLQYFDCSE